MFLGRKSGRGSSLRDIPNRMNLSKRIGLLRRRMSGSGLQGLLVTHLPDDECYIGPGQASRTPNRVSIANPSGM